LVNIDLLDLKLTAEKIKKNIKKMIKKIDMYFIFFENILTILYGLKLNVFNNTKFYYNN